MNDKDALQAEHDALVAESERQRRMYKTALNSTPDFDYVFDTAHRALYASASLLRTWRVDDVRGKRWTWLAPYGNVLARAPCVWWH